MRRFRMVVVQVRSQMVSNYNVPGYSRLENVLLHVAREVAHNASAALPNRRSNS